LINALNITPQGEKNNCSPKNLFPCTRAFLVSGARAAPLYLHGACQAGMKTVFFRSNQGDQEYRDTRADYVIYNFRELPEALAFLER